MSPPDTPVIAVPADGVMGGDYMEGIRLCLQTLAERLVRRDAEKKPDTVNLIGEVGVNYNNAVDYLTLTRLLGGMGIRVGCRFLGDCTVEELRDLCAAPLNLLAADSEDNRRLKSWLEREYGCVFLEGVLPVGFRETRDFLLRIGRFFGREKEAEALIRREEESCREELQRLRPLLQGKRVMMTAINTNLDWLLDAAEDCGVEFVWVGVLNYLRRELHITDRRDRKLRIEEITGFGPLAERIRELQPDLVLTNYTAGLPEGDYLTDALPMTQPIGFRSGLEVLRRWVTLEKETGEGEWIHDGELFGKYYA